MHNKDPCRSLPAYPGHRLIPSPFRVPDSVEEMKDEIFRFHFDEMNFHEPCSKDAADPKAISRFAT